MQKIISNKALAYETLLKKHRGLIQMGIKLPIRDVKALSLVYTPGVAASCLEIQKDNLNANKYTNKLNGMLIVTDSSAGNFKRPNWHDLAATPYLEGISALYKKVANIDCYPIIIDSKELRTGEELAETIHCIMPGFSAVEFYNVDENRMIEYRKASEMLSKDKGTTDTPFITVNSVNKQLTKTNVNINLIYAAALRVALDTQAYTNLNDLVNHLIEYTNSTNNTNNTNKTTNTENLTVHERMEILIAVAYEYIDSNKMITLTNMDYNINSEKLSKEYVLNKYDRFLTEGNNGWTTKFPKNYFSNKNTCDINSLLLHYRHKGIVSSELKVPFQSVHNMMNLANFENFEYITQKIIEDPSLAKELTCHGNLGAIVSNGTAVLGLGNIGALAGLPVMEGKSVLFKMYGGVDIIPMVINERDKLKLVNAVRRISPIFSIFNLEDIKAPDCFLIESLLNEMSDFPVFHDDQHGTGIVTLAGVMNAIKLTKKDISKCKIVMNGAGAAGLSVTELLLTWGSSNFIVCDTVGALYKGRVQNMNEFKERLALMTNQNSDKGTLKDVIKGADIFIGLSKPKMLNKEMVESMNKNPIIFALANPEPEIYPNEAKEAGAYIVATGRSDFPNQINNSLAFPGLFRAAIDIRARDINIRMKIAAARGIAELVKEEELTPNYIMPNAMDTRVPAIVAKSVAQECEELGLIRNKKMTPELVEENIESWFHEGELRNFEYMEDSDYEWKI